MQSDEAMMADVFETIEDNLKKKIYNKALQLLQDAASMPAWKEKYGSHIIIGEAYAKLFDAKREKKLIDTIEIRKSLLNLTEDKINDLPEFYQ